MRVISSAGAVPGDGISRPLSQQTLFKQGLHISPPIQNAVDCDTCLLDAIHDPVGLGPDFQELRHADVLQLWRDIIPQGRGTKRETRPLQRIKQLVGLPNGIGHCNISVDFEKVISSINVELDIKVSHS